MQCKGAMPVASGSDGNLWHGPLNPFPLGLRRKYIRMVCVCVCWMASNRPEEIYFSNRGNAVKRKPSTNFSLGTGIWNEFFSNDIAKNEGIFLLHKGTLNEEFFVL